MTAVATPDAARLVFAAVAGLILLLVLIIKFKVHAMISILIGAVGIGLMAGMPLSDIIGSVNEGIGNTLKGIALLVGLGSMFGAILEESGGAQTLAVTMVRKFGDEKAAWALGITGLVVAMPVFFDAGLIILIPLAFSLAKRTKRSVCAGMAVCTKDQFTRTDIILDHNLMADTLSFPEVNPVLFCKISHFLLRCRCLRTV